MRIEDIFDKIKGNLGSQAYIKLSDDTVLNEICYGILANEYGDIFLVISEEKSKTHLPTGLITDIQFPD